MKLRWQDKTTLGVFGGVALFMLVGGVWVALSR